MGGMLNKLCLGMVLAAIAAPAFAAAPPSAPLPPSPRMPHYRFVNYTTANGLPNNHVYSVLVDGSRIWAGTDDGLGLYENARWRTFTTRDGLAQQAVLSLALDKRTGDVWAGTMGGLNRISGGRIIATYNQLNSGLSNDIVYGVSVEGKNVWVATAAGACRLNLDTNQWSIYTDTNTPMKEIWAYGVSAAPDKVYFAIWGSGLLEYNQQTRLWDIYEDPDHQTDIVLFKDQGLIHDIVSSVSYVEKTVWVATYFGASRYDGRYWHNFLTKDSGLPSNFINYVKAVDANHAWFCTDKGLAYYDGANWAVYTPSLTNGKPEMWVSNAQGHAAHIPVTTAPANNYMLGIDFQGRDIWIATAGGLSHGIFEPQP